MKLFARFLVYLRPYAGRMIVATILLTVAGGMMSLAIATLKPFVNEVLLANPPAPEAADAAAVGGPDLLGQIREWLPTAEWTAFLRERAFVAVPVLILVIAVARGFCLFYGRYLVTLCGVSVIRALRLALYESVVFQSPRFFQAHSTGDIQSRVLSDVQRVQRVSTEVLADLVRVSAMVPFLLLLVFIHDWRFALFTLVVAPLVSLPVFRLGRRLRRASRRGQEHLAEASSLLHETVTGIKVVQGFVMELFELERFRAALDRILRAQLKAGRAEALVVPVMELAAALAGAGLFYFAGVGIARGTLDPGDFAVVLGGLAMLLLSLRRLGRVNVEIQQALASAERVFEMLDCPRDVRDAAEAGTLPPFRREIAFEGVDFAYDSDKVLDGVDLVIRQGEVVALVGPSGSGKTTLAHLVLRFHDPTAGRVAIDGHDLRGVTLASLRDQIGLVTQETVLFDDTVHHNIAYGRNGVPREQVEAAARAAHAHEFIERMAEGYDARLGERGTRLSMGQRQRIAIARALVKDPPLLIFDEATSALDSESERVVEEALGALLQGRTSLIIAHRLATVRRADRILVMDAGRIVEQGTHDDLLARGGLYRRLYDLQFRDGDLVKPSLRH